MNLKFWSRLHHYFKIFVIFYFMPYLNIEEFHPLQMIYAVDFPPTHTLKIEKTIQVKKIEFKDEKRARLIPVIYYHRAEGNLPKMPVVILNHGHNVKNDEYSYLAEPLAQLGYLVISIQHQLPTDPSPTPQATL